PDDVLRGPAPGRGRRGRPRPPHQHLARRRPAAAVGGGDLPHRCGTQAHRRVAARAAGLPAVRSPSVHVAVAAASPAPPISGVTPPAAAARRSPTFTSAPQKGHLVRLRSRSSKHTQAASPRAEELEEIMRTKWQHVLGIVMVLAVFVAGCGGSEGAANEEAPAGDLTTEE